MSLLQRRHFNHLAEMSKEIDDCLNPYRTQRNEVRRIILTYMMRANSNFDEYRFGKASGWYLDE